jgi:glycyl-tRNA synthetase beta chain
LAAEAVVTLPFPKLMRWESSGFRFPRPIRWIVVLLDKKVLPVRLADVKSGCRTLGHRFLSPHPLKILEADWGKYQTALRKAHVILPLEERKRMIRKALKNRCAQSKFDEDLISLNACLTEEPFVIQGTFSKTYLELPGEVLAGCMKKNQKIFARYDAKGRLVNRFAAVLNGGRKGLARIRADYENVLESRLRDARYFYEADTAAPFETKQPLLDQIVYLGKLGSMRDKTVRLEKAAEFFCDCIGRHDVREDLKRVAALSKIDLITQMVYEFPDLQGIMGREYALESGEKEEVAGAVGLQYHPKNLGENYKSLAAVFHPLGAMFGILDRLDLLVGAFGSGIELTGSQDPYALRRAGGGLVKILRAFRFHFSMDELAGKIADLYGAGLTAPREEWMKRLKVFLKERVVFETGAKPGTRHYEILQAVFASSFDDLADVYERSECLERIHQSDPAVFFKAAKVVERTTNILKGSGSLHRQEIRPDLFQTIDERNLYQLLEDHEKTLSTHLQAKDYEKATAVFGRAFYGPLNDFFDKIMINVDEPELRLNRQLLMLKINRLYTETLADLSLLSRLDEK